MTDRAVILEGGEFDMRRLTITDEEVPPEHIEPGGPTRDVYRLLTDDDGRPATDIMGKLRYRVLTPLTEHIPNTWHGFPEGSIVQHHVRDKSGFSLG